MNIARVASFKAGLPYQVPAQTINRFCSSGLQAISLAADRILAGFADCIIAGGVESMSSIPMGGNKYSANPDLVKDWPESYAAMGTTAEEVADKYKISREAMDHFAFESHQKAAQAIQKNQFKEEIIPIPVWAEKTTENDPEGAIFSTMTTEETLSRSRPPYASGTSTANSPNSPSAFI